MCIPFHHSIYIIHQNQLFCSYFSMSYGADHKSGVLSSPDYSVTAVLDMDQESCGSSAEEVESPRSVVREGRNRKSGDQKGRAHSQVLRIRAEDLHIGEEKLNKLGFRDLVMIFSRPILPASPLGGKADGH